MNLVWTIIYLKCTLNDWKIGYHNILSALLLAETKNLFCLCVFLCVWVRSSEPLMQHILGARIAYSVQVEVLIYFTWPQLTVQCSLMLLLQSNQPKDIFSSYTTQETQPVLILLYENLFSDHAIVIAMLWQKTKQTHNKWLKIKRICIFEPRSEWDNTITAFWCVLLQGEKPPKLKQIVFSLSRADKTEPKFKKDLFGDTQNK